MLQKLDFEVVVSLVWWETFFKMFKKPFFAQNKKKKIFRYITTDYLLY